MRLAVGDLVVYGSHGAGAIVARRTRDLFGNRQVVVVLALAGGLSVELPLARADTFLRPIADQTEITRVHDVLSAAAVPSDVPWLKRRRDELAKLQTTVGLAEIIRDATGRQEARGPLSPSESELFRRARNLLATEIALALDIELSDATDWIDQQLSES